MKERLDVLLVNKGFYPSREKAKTAIMAGLVFVDGQISDKAGMSINIDCDIKVKQDLYPYVSRGGLKLEKAIDLFSIDLKDKVCMDVGASTGGFTDCMLMNGAAKVYAVDVGYGQLAWKLRSDSRVINIEKCNFRYFDQSQVDEEIDFMSRFIPAGATIFDIGANVGRVSLGLAKAHEDSTIYAFEPVEETFRGLEKNLRLNGEAEHVKACHMGFYSECGDLKFFVPAANEAASLRPSTDAYYFKEGDQGQGERRDRLDEVVCPVDTLDDFVEKHGVKRLDFIKCDTEGAEKMVFSGGAHVFLEMRPVVYTEMLRKHAARFDYHPNEIIEMFKGWGYACYTSDGKRLLPFENMDESTIETNFFFLHGEKHRELLEEYGG